jgi:hypothetical protein
MASDRRTIIIGEHKILLPVQPPKREIFFSNKPVADQYWCREHTAYPEEFFAYSPSTKLNAEFTHWDDDHEALLQLSKADTNKLYLIREEEIRRRREGVWFMNHGEPTYLTGDHYFALQWGAMMDFTNPYDGTNYGEFREFQWKVALFMWHCEQDDVCLGGYIIKPKKTGITQLLALFLLNRATMMKQKRFGMMSKTNDDCKDTNMVYLKFALDELPFIFKPEYTDNLSEIKFAKPRIRNTGSKSSQLKQLDNGKGFNTYIKAAATVEKGFDGPKYYWVWIDEFPKIKSTTTPAKVFESSSQTVKLGRKLIGKMWLSSYPPEKDDESFLEGRKVYMDSLMNTVDSHTGQTTSELKAYHISALESGEGSFDRYGKADKKSNEEWLDNRRAQLEKDKPKLQAFIRQYSKNAEEAWRIGGGGGSSFDGIRMGLRLSDLMDDLSAGHLPYVEGNLEWVDGISGRLKGAVRFVPITDREKEEGLSGIWRDYGIKNFENLPANYAPAFNAPYLRNLKDVLERYMPDPNCYFQNATDPTDYALKTDVVVGSKDAIICRSYGHAGIDTLRGEQVTDDLLLVYLDRPENPNDYYEELIKLLFFTGSYVYVENNKPWVRTKMIEDNLHNFLLVKDSNNNIVPFNLHRHKNLPTATTKDTVNELVRVAKVYYVPSRIARMKDERVIDHYMSFDPTQTKKYDAAMCDMSCIRSMDAFSSYKVRMMRTEVEHDAKSIALAYKIIQG